MAGAAAVVAGIGALTELAVPVRALAVVAAAENMPSGRSMRPRYRHHPTTARRSRSRTRTPRGDRARRTPRYASSRARPMWSTSRLSRASWRAPRRPVRGDLRQRRRVGASSSPAGNASGDYVWPFPLDPRYRRVIDLAFADMKN